jgi:hypothetical protein
VEFVRSGCLRGTDLDVFKVAHGFPDGMLTVAGRPITRGR